MWVKLFDLHSHRSVPLEGGLNHAKDFFSVAFNNTSIVAFEDKLSPWDYFNTGAEVLVE